MRKIIQYIVSLTLVLLLILSCCSEVLALEVKETELEFDAKSAVLIDYNTGTLLYPSYLDFWYSLFISLLHQNH